MGARRSDPTNQFLQFDEERGFDIVGELEKIAGAHQATITQVALNYLLWKPGVTSVIVGARNAAQLEDNLKTITWEMTADEVARLDALSMPPRLYPYWMLEMMARDR
jgi:aryl-alcohol dehydrogenase-like predicted oxidoreductase